MAPNKKSYTPELMIVNDSPGEECRIAIVQDHHLEELYSERTASATGVGNIYKGRVTNVESAIQAAFIDYGRGVNGFLHISDLHPKYFPKGKDRTERVGKKIPRRHRPPIQEALKRGDEILVQVLKEGIGTKGPTLTSYLSVPGRLIVMMPDMDRVGVSRKIEDEEKRRQMRQILDSLDLPEGFGFILRTAGFDQPKTELKRDVAYLTRLWKMMDKRIKTMKAPCELYTESDLLIRTIRDVVRTSIEAIVVDSESAHRRVTDFLRVVAPRSAPNVIRYRSRIPIFHAFDIERQIELIHSREVPLPSGGKLVIDQTEALVAIDVNSGKSRAARDSESNAYNTNCEAVDEICRQLRLRDLGGLIIHDLIDMRYTKNRKAIEERFANSMKRDRARSTILPISEFGLVEMTRQRMRPSMRKSHFVDCPVCNGYGEIKSAESVAADATRHAGYLLQFDRVKRVEVVCSSRVATVMLSTKRRELVRLEDAFAGFGKKIEVRVSDTVAPDRVDYYAYDDRGADVDVEKLPPPHIPTLKDLEEAEKQEKSAGDTNKVDSRLDKKAKADAPASFDLAADEDDVEVTTDGSRKKKRSRRGRRGGKGRNKGQTVSADTKPSAQKSAEAVRIFTLAKELGVPSRAIVERCQDEPSLDVKNHMSSVLGRAVAKIRSWFESDTPPIQQRELRENEQEHQAADEKVATPSDKPPTTETSKEAEQPSRRRRRRRGGQKSREAAAAPQSSEQVETQTPVEDASPKNGSVSSQKAQSKPKRERRRRRGKKPQAEDAQPTSVTNSSVSESTADNAASKPEPKDAAVSKAKSGSSRKPRRSLYRSRSKVSSSSASARGTDADTEE